MLSTVDSESKIYKEVLRKVLRSQINYMVDQLAETGEESFVISASGEDDEPHISGSKLGLSYMQGFRGVLDGFPNFIQRNLKISGKNQAIGKIKVRRCWSIAKPTEDSIRSNEDSIESSHTKQFISSTLQAQYDGKIEEMNNDTVANANHISYQQLPPPSSELEMEVIKTRQSFVQEQYCHPVPNEIPMEISIDSSQIGNLETDSEQDHTKHMPDLERFDRGEIGFEKLSDNFIPDETTDISEISNEATRNSADRLDEADKVDDTEVDMPLYNSAYRLDEPDKVDDNGVDTPMDLQADTINSDEEESDFDCNESDYDELKEDEIFSRLINDFENNKTDLNTEVMKDDANYEENMMENDEKSSQAEKFNQEPQVGSEEKTENKMHDKIRTTVCNGEEVIDDVVAVALSNFKTVYKYKDKIYHLKDLLSPKLLFCKYCQKRSRTLKEVREHEGKHTKTYSCYKCDRDFLSLANLRDHNPRCYNVPKLVKDFFRQNPDVSSKPCLNNHKKSVNTSKPDTKQSFKCHRCFKKFHLRICLKMHVCKPVTKDRIQSEHSNTLVKTIKPIVNSLSFKAHMSSLAGNSTLGDTTSLYSNQNVKKSVKFRTRKLECQYCEKTYLTSSNLRDHITVHTGEKNLKCSICSQRFLTSSNFSRHK